MNRKSSGDSPSKVEEKEENASGRYFRVRLQREELQEVRMD